MHYSGAIPRIPDRGYPSMLGHGCHDKPFLARIARSRGLAHVRLALTAHQEGEMHARSDRSTQPPLFPQQDRTDQQNPIKAESRQSLKIGRELKGKGAVTQIKRFSLVKTHGGGGGALGWGFHPSFVHSLRWGASVPTSHVEALMLFRHGRAVNRAHHLELQGADCPIG
jgi:hypothetical protein